MENRNKPILNECKFVIYNIKLVKFLLKNSQLKLSCVDIKINTIEYMCYKKVA